MRIVVLLAMALAIAASTALVVTIGFETFPLALRTDPGRVGDGLRGSGAAIGTAVMLLLALPGLWAALAFRNAASGLGWTALVAVTAFAATVAGYEFALSGAVPVQTLGAVLATAGAGSPAVIIGAAMLRQGWIEGLIALLAAAIAAAFLIRAI